MVNITHKSTTLRKAIAQAIVQTGSVATVQRVRERSVPKGDVLEMAKTAGLFAAKKTAEMIPDCHPLPIEFTAVRYELGETTITIAVEVHTVYKTGVEVEAMHAASVVALTIYDMLKPIDSQVSIKEIKLLEKTGGKSALKKIATAALTATVVVCSDSIAAGKKEDRAGKVIIQKLEAMQVPIRDYMIIPDEPEAIAQTLTQQREQATSLLIYTGGTGLSPRDQTPEALRPLLDKTIPGIEEAIRAYGQQRTPFSMLSRSVAGFAGEMLVLALPGSTKGAEESMDAIFPAVLHLFRVREGARHD